MAEDIILDVPRIGQANSKICWLACYQMLYRWKGKAAHEVSDKIQKAGFSTSSGLYEEDWGKAAAVLGLSGMRVSHLKGFDNLAWCLGSCGPIWCAGNFAPDGGGHAIVISGLYHADQKLRINDPYEIYRFDSYSYMTHDQWCKKVRVAPFACQLWW